MKKTLLTVLLWLAAAAAWAQPVRFFVGEGMENGPLKEKVNTNVSLLLTEINDAYNGSRALDLSAVSITPRAVRLLSMLWRNRPFHCDELRVVDRILRTFDGGYQLRNIPMEMTEPGGKVLYPELVVELDAGGTITLVNFAIEAKLYRKVVQPGSGEREMNHRKIMLDYVEQFRTSYDRKDLNFLELFFCDDALIITGRVVKKYVREPGAILEKAVLYPQYANSEYLANLRRVFSQIRYSRTYFKDIQVTHHPVEEGVYGVNIKMGYESAVDSDEGCVFLLWDFRDGNRPQILVRTWQPRWLDDAHTQALSESQIINVNSFKFP